jgi:hypothetical protein
MMVGFRTTEFIVRNLIRIRTISMKQYYIFHSVFTKWLVMFKYWTIYYRYNRFDDADDFKQTSNNSVNI